MKRLPLLFAVAAILLTGTFFVYSQNGVDVQVRSAVLYRPRIGEKYDLSSKLAELKKPAQVNQSLINMLKQYKYAARGTPDFICLKVATTMLGRAGEKSAVAPLKALMFDSKVDQDVRAEATRSLGMIDLPGNKETLLKALSSSQANSPARIHAVEALVKTNDPEVLAKLEQFSSQEIDPVLKQKFDESVRIMKRKSNSGKASETHP